jgi:hypothetical protein
MSPGGAYEVFNASSSTVQIQCGTIAHPSQKPFSIPRGFGDWGSGDHSELIFLRVKYPSSRTITLDRREMDRIRGASQFRRGAWWIDDSGVTYIAAREANFRQRAFR